MIGDVLAVLGVLAVLAFVLEIGLERVKDLIPWLANSWTFKLAGKDFELKPMNWIAVAAGIGLMFILVPTAPISIFAPFGTVPFAVDAILNGLLIAGGSNKIYDIVRSWEDKGAE